MTDTKDTPGWKLVPIEPDYRMKQAGAVAGKQQAHQAYWEAIADYVYRAMLAAAPSPVPQQTDKLRAVAQLYIDTIHGVENRCMAVDGPVTQTHQEITDAELRAVYVAASDALADPDGEWNCPDCKGSGDSGRLSRGNDDRPELCGTCMGRGTLDYNPNAPQQAGEAAPLKLADLLRPDDMPPARAGDMRNSSAPDDVLKNPHYDEHLMGPQPSDAHLLHLWSEYVGEPTAKRPLTDKDKIAFARAVLDRAMAGTAQGERERDAARYRWLRDKTTERHDFYADVERWSVSKERRGYGQNFSGAKLDEAVDAAMAAQSPGEQK